MIQRKFHFTSALTSSGLAEGRERFVDQHGMIENVEAGMKDGTRSRHCHPAVAKHSHAHQRLMVGLAERAGPGRTVSDLREAMYGLLEALAR
jgi:hypothetical protein